MKHWILIGAALVVICTALAVLLVSVLEDRRKEAQSIQMAGLWELELWNIAQGFQVDLIFSGSMTLGRSSLYSNVRGNLPAQVDTTISREHCMLYEQNGILLIWNLSSVNPAVINGCRLNSSRQIFPGDRLELGNSVFLVTRVNYLG